jgi:hypothetical protein
MKAGRVISIILGALLAIPAFGIFAGGAIATIGSARESGDNGYFDQTLDRLATPTPAITTGDIDLRTDPGPDWVESFLDVSVRFQLETDEGADLFLGIGPEDDVTEYLSGVARDEIRRVSGSSVRYTTVSGQSQAEPPADRDFWAASVSGTGSQTLEWDVEDGQWIVVLMNSDGGPGVFTDMTVGIRSGALLGIGITMLIVGALLLLIAVLIIRSGARGPRPVAEREPAAPAPAPAMAGAAAHPVRLESSIDPDLSSWKWLVKWFLAIPHLIVLAFLWVGFVVVWVISLFAILFTGRYPRGLFDYNVGVARWTWRVMVYAFSGGLSTDKYPPFSLSDDPAYPATLTVAYPEQLSRGLALVKWWLLAIPHYVVVGIMLGGGMWLYNDGWQSDAFSVGLIGALVFIAAVILLFTDKYPRSLFDLIVGLNRWGFRVFAYAALLTDEYPPFRLDQGGREPVGEMHG